MAAPVLVNTICDKIQENFYGIILVEEEIFKVSQDLIN